MSRARDFADLAGSSSNISTVAADSANLDQVASSYSAGGITGKNVLINGNFDVWQRATSFTDTAGIWNYGHADRWNGHNDGANAGTWSQSTTVPNSGSKYSMLMTGGTSVTNTNMTQKIESVNLQGVRAANAFTLSGWVRSSVAGKVINFHGLCPTASDNYASYTQHNGLMTSVTITGDGTTGTSQITLTSADTWYYFTATKTNATSLTNFENGYAPFFSIIGQTSSSHQVYMSQLQLEVGEQATPFEHRSFGDELRRCQRYYQKSYNYEHAPGNTTNNGAYQFFHPSSTIREPNVRYETEMRVNPTETFYAPDSGTSGKVRNRSTNADETAVIGDTGSKGFNLSMSITANNHYGFHYTADAEV